MVRWLARKRLPGRDRAALIVAPIVLIVWVCASCGNSCFVFISNPSSGTIIVGAGSSGSGCLAPAPHGTVRVAARLVPVCDGCAAENRIQRLFLTLDGIELHSTPAGGQNVGEWQQIQPAFEQNPVQFELETSFVQVTPNVALGSPSTVPAGHYDYVRLRLAGGQFEGHIPFGVSACGAARLSCAQTADGRTYPLAVNARIPEVLSSLAELQLGSLIVAPDSENRLDLELTPFWSVVSDGNELQFLPSFVTHSKLAPTAAFSSATETSESDQIGSLHTR